MLKFIKIEEEAIIPARKYEGDAGLDIFAKESFVVRRRSQEAIRTGIQLAHCPPNVVLFVWPKSGLDTQFGLSTGAGVIDPNYRGEIVILVRNMSNYDLEVEKGDAFAQLVPVALPYLDVKETGEVEATSRGRDGGIVRRILGENNESKKD